MIKEENPEEQERARAITTIVKQTQEREAENKRESERENKSESKGRAGEEQMET